ncbi:cytochrome P450 [Catellatospora sp. KI3]|uniref:cytochrome P450 family protein n=1 Tax=Catellatospora sp. KI3 TaxID=3041620 RepID=UPI0024829040|nr:cytochrome P450 [Catellatospora sp. KI3]MDI1460869.1 cytochrome P450 [Catellatospora sp. KI3]
MTAAADSQTGDPHQLLAGLRSASPAHRIPLGPAKTGWLVTRHADVKQALNDPRLSKAALKEVRLTGSLPLPADVQAATSTHMLNADPPQHTRLRRLVSRAFTARRIEGLRPRVEQLAGELLDRLEDRPEADLIDDFAFPLPFQVVCELIGLPDVDRDAFRGWTNTMVAGAAVAPEQTHAAGRAAAGYVARLLERKRAEPDDALLSGLIQASDAGDRLTADELSSMVFVLLLAGHETTVNLIGNTICLLLRRPELMAALRADESLLPRVIEETLRYESPVKNATLRLTVAPVTYGDVTIPAGEIVVLSLMSANRDGASFTDPDGFDPGRPDADRHLAFGHGIHFCLGAPVARLEAQVAVGALLRRFPALSAAVPLEQLEWRPGLLMHGPVHLPARLV